MTVRLEITRTDVVWSYLNLGLSNAVNLLLLPLVLVSLTPDEVGLWFVFGAIGALVVVMDLGLSTTFSRQVSFAWCGADELQKEGVSVVDDARPPNFRLLRDLLWTLRIVYVGIAAVALVATGVLGTWHVWGSIDSSVGRDHALAAWLIYLAAIVLNMAFAYWAPVLRGIGAVAQSHQSNVISKVVQLILTTVLLIVGLGIVGVGVAYLTSTFIGRLAAIWFFKRHHDIKAGLARLDAPRPARAWEIVRILWPVTGRQGVVSVSQYVLMSAPVLVASAFLGLADAGMVGLAVQLLNLVRVFSNALFNAYLPLFARMRIEGDTTGLLGLFARSLGVSTYVIIGGGLMIALLAGPLLRLLGSEVSMLPTAVLVIFVLSEALVNQTALSSAFLATGNRVRMHRAYVVTVALAVGLQVALAGLAGWGLWGVFVPPLAAFMTYHGWIWFLRAAHDVRVRPSELLGHMLLCGVRGRRIAGGE